MSATMLSLFASCDSRPVDPSERLSKLDWTIRAASHAEAVELVERCHYAQGAPNTGVYRHGLFRDDWSDKLMGVAIWLPPTKPAALSVAPEHWRGVLGLSRFVLDPSVPFNGASFLLGRSMRRIDRGRWPVLLTYADTSEGHIGTIYKATNWECLGPVPAGDVWVNQLGEQRGRKRGGRNYLASEMRALGFNRKPAAPKIKYVHRSTPDARRCWECAGVGTVPFRDRGAACPSCHGTGKA